MARLGPVLAVALAAAVLGGAPPATGAPSLPIPHVFSGLVVDPAPSPTPADGRIPASLRLTDSIWSDDGSHPPAATEARFDFDRNFRLDLSGVPRCPRGVHFDIRTEESRCEKVKFATGRIKFEVALPEVEPLLVAGRAIAYKVDSRTMMIRGWFPAPITGEVLIPVELGKAPPGSIYGLRATASIPKVAGGSGSLVYLGLRFRKGLFSVACPKRGLQSQVTNSFADGSVASSALLSTC